MKEYKRDTPLYYRIYGMTISGSIGRFKAATITLELVA